MESKYEKQKIYRQNQLKKGLCQKCSRKAVIKAACEYHRNYARKYAHAYYVRTRKRMYQSKETLKHIYLKQVAEQIKQFRRVNRITQQELGNRTGIDNASISHWESELYYPTLIAIEKLERFGIPFTQEQKDVALDYSEYRKNTRPTWEEKFDRYYTRVGNSDNAEGYDGDDWKVNRVGEPVKPSVIKEFIKNIVLKGGE